VRASFSEPLFVAPPIPLGRRILGRGFAPRYGLWSDAAAAFIPFAARNGPGPSARNTQREIRNSLSGYPVVLARS